MILRLGMWGLGPIIVCSNDDPRWTLTYFTARSNLVSYALGKTVKKSFNGRNLQQMIRVTLGLCLYKNSDPKGLSALAPGLYTCIKHEKLCIKSDFKDIFLKLATSGQSDKTFLLTSGFCLQRVVCSCQGAIYIWKNIKKCV